MPNSLQVKKDILLQHLRLSTHALVSINVFLLSTRIHVYIRGDSKYMLIETNACE